MHSFGGKHNALPGGGLDGATSCYYRTLPLLYVRESDAVVAALKQLATLGKIKNVLKQ